MERVKRIPSTEEIEIAIASLFGRRRNIIVPNISWGLNLHECDMLIIRDSGFAVEVEIKRSKQDLLNDFKKRHGHRSTKIKEFYYAIPQSKVQKWKELIPEKAGIITYERGDGGWVYANHYRMAKKKPCRKLTEAEILKAAKLGCMRIWDLKERLYNNMFGA